MQNPSENRIRGVLFLAFLLTYAYFFQGGGWNQNARLDQVWAVVVDGTLTIDRFMEPTPNTGDAALYDGHYYPNKPPGVSLLGVPVAAALMAVEFLLGIDSFGSLKVLHLNAHVITVMTVSALSAALMVVFYTALNWLRPSPPWQRLLVTVGYGLGTLAFPWSTLFQSHQVSAALTFMVFALFLYRDFGQRGGSPGSGELPLVGETPGRAPPQSRPAASRLGPASLLNLDALAGLLGGLALMVGYNNAPVVALLAIYRFAGPRPAKATASFLVGFLPPIALLLAYHQLCFGSVLATSYRYENLQFEAPGGVIFGLPDPSVLLEITVKPFRGLFWSSPLLLLAIPGFCVFLMRRYGRQLEAIVCLAVVAYYFVFNLSFIHWHGGWCAGPRYLIPCLPFMAAALHFALPSMRAALYVLLPLSILLQASITAVNPSTPHKVSSPVAYTLDRLWDDGVSDNTQTLLEKFPPEHIGVPVEPHHAWSSFNLGEISGLNGLGSLVPLLIVWVMAGVWFGRRTRA